MSLNREQIAVIKGMLARGDKQSWIAFYFDQNSGRIGEISAGTNSLGKRAREIPPAQLHELPEPGPYMPVPHRYKAVHEVALNHIQQWERLNDEA